MTANRQALICGVIALAMLVALGVTMAAAHSFYSLACCSNLDCGPTTGVKWSEAGWVIEATGETVPFNDMRIKESPDVQFHTCLPASWKRVRCLYVPGPGI